MREGGRKDAAATAALNQIGMTITHEGIPHNLSLLPKTTHALTKTQTHKVCVTSSDGQPDATHTAVSPLIGSS